MPPNLTGTAFRYFPHEGPEPSSSEVTIPETSS